MTDIFLYSGDANPNNVVLSDPTTLRGGTKVDYTLSLAAGAYAYSGKSAALSVARNLALAVGAYAYSGKSAAVNVARNLPLAVGAYSYSGKAITVDLERKMPLAAGAYAYAGNAATLTYVPGAGAVSYSLVLDTGAYVYTGIAASLSATSNVPAGASGKQYNTRNLDPNKWGKNKKKLEAKVRAIEVKIARKRKQLELAPTLNTEVIARQLMALQSQLLELLAILDEYRKQQELAEDAEVMAIYLAYRRLH